MQSGKGKTVFGNALSRESLAGVANRVSSSSAVRRPCPWTIWLPRHRSEDAGARNVDQANRGFGRASAAARLPGRVRDLSLRDARSGLRFRIRALEGRGGLVGRKVHAPAAVGHQASRPGTESAGLPSRGRAAVPARGERRPAPTGRPVCVDARAPTPQVRRDRT